MIDPKVRNAQGERVAMDQLKKYKADLQDVSIQLEEANSKVSALLARIEHDSGAKKDGSDVSPLGDFQHLTIASIDAIIKARKLRDDAFSADMFFDPAWDIILFLMRAKLTNEQVAITQLCQATPIPYTTVLRWLSDLERRGLIVKTNDPLDGRRIFLALSPKAVAGLKKWYNLSIKAL